MTYEYLRTGIALRRLAGEIAAAVPTVLRVYLLSGGVAVEVAELADAGETQARADLLASVVAAHDGSPASYTYSIAADTPGVVDAGRLEAELDEAAIDPDLVSVSVSGDALTLQFADDLRDHELEQVWARLASHSGTPLPVRYEFVAPLSIDHAVLDAAIRSAIPGMLGLGTSSALLYVLVAATLSAADQTTLAAVVAAHQGWRTQLADACDAETRRRIALGYTVTGVSRKSPTVPVELLFSLSAQAQMNLAGFDPALVDSWPLQWDCADDSDALILADAAATAAFILQGKGMVAYRVQYGRLVRRAVMDATTQAEAEAACAAYLAGS